MQQLSSHRSDRPLRAALYPFSPGVNAYQAHVAASLERAGVLVERIAPRRRAPHRAIAAVGSDVLHFDWLSDLYTGRSIPAAMFKAATYAAFLRQLRTRRAVYTVHNLEAHERPTSLRTERSNVQALVKRLDGLVHLSDYARTSFESLYPASARLPTVTLMHGHYCDDYPRTITAARAREELGISKSARVALCFGLIRRYKGFEEFANLFAATSEPGDVLLVAGAPHDPSVVSGLRAAAERSRGRIRVYDRSVPVDEVGVLMAAADVGIVPARRITNSGSAILYLSFGLPVAAYRVGSLPEVLPPDRCLITSELDDPSMVEAALQLGLLHRRRRDENVERTRSQFSWDVFGQRLAAFYHELVSATST